jgi:hypothetical protein
VPAKVHWSVVESEYVDTGEAARSLRVGGGAMRKWARLGYIRYTPEAPSGYRYVFNRADSRDGKACGVCPACRPDR